MSDDPNQPSEGGDAPSAPPWTPPPAPTDPTTPSAAPPEAPAFTPAVPAMAPGAPLGGTPTDEVADGPDGPGAPGGPPGPATPAPDAGGGDRPPPDRWSLIAAAGGLLAALGLLALLSEPDIADERGLVLLVSALFEVLGIGLVLLHRNGRAAAGGVALSLLAALPLVDAVVRDPSDPLASFGDVTSYRNQQIVVLALLAAAWLALYLVGPARRFGAFLGGALLALWSIPMTWFSLSAVDDLFSAFGGFDLLGNDVFGDPFDADLAATGDDLSLKLGLTSLVFGAAYLALGGLLDRRGEGRRATPFFAVAPYVLIGALAYLQEDLDVIGTAALGLVLGAASIWLGASAGRRFTSWIGVAAVVGAVLSLVGEAFEDSAVGAGLALAIVGVVAVVGAGLLESRSTT